MKNSAIKNLALALVGFLLTVALLAAFAPNAQALSITMAQATDPLDVVTQVFVNLSVLAGVTAVIVGLVNIGKTAGWIHDETAGRWYSIFSLVAIVILVTFRLVRPDLGLDYLDAQAQKIAAILVVLGGYLGMLVGGPLVHDTFSNLRLPLIGKSFSKTK